MKKQFKFLVLALIVTNIVFISIATSYKNKLEDVRESFRLYSLSGENKNLKVTDGMIIESYDKDILNLGSVEYLGKVNKDVIEYEIDIFIEGKNKMDTLYGIKVMTTEKNVNRFGENIDLTNNYGITSAEVITKNFDREYMRNNMYLTLKLKMKNGKEEIYKVKLDVRKI